MGLVRCTSRSFYTLQAKPRYRVITVLSSSMMASDPFLSIFYKFYFLMNFSIKTPCFVYIALTKTPASVTM